MTRAEKIQLLTNIKAGKQPVGHLRPVKFLELSESEGTPGIYTDASGEAYTQPQLDALVKKYKKDGGICFVEIRTYKK